MLYYRFEQNVIDDIITKIVLLFVVSLPLLNVSEKWILWSTKPFKNKIKFKRF